MQESNGDWSEVDLDTTFEDLGPDAKLYDYSKMKNTSKPAESQTNIQYDEEEKIEENLTLSLHVPKKVIRILSLDGGGVRGLIEAIILSQLEEDTGKQTYELFDFVVGTSTGGILATLLTVPTKENPLKPLSANRIVEIYKTLSKEVFRPEWFRWGFARSKFPIEPIEKLISQFYSAETSLQDAKTHLGVTVSPSSQKVPLLLNSFMSRKDVFPHNVPVIKALRATSAAPTYLDPVEVHVPKEYQMEGSKGFIHHFGASKFSGYNLVLQDGGVTANNPSKIGMEFCDFFCKEFGIEANVQIVSVGTGELNQEYYKASTGSNKLEVLANLFKNLVSDALSVNQNGVETHLSLKALYENSKSVKYLRLQPKLEEKIDLADSSDDALYLLETLATEYLNSQEYADLVLMISSSENIRMPREILRLTNPSEIPIVLCVGNTQVGKSFVCNSALFSTGFYRQDVFETGDSTNSQTKESKEGIVLTDRGKFVIIDTPGSHDTESRQSEFEIFSNFLGFLDTLPRGVTMILYCVKADDPWNMYVTDPLSGFLSFLGEKFKNRVHICLTKPKEETSEKIKSVRDVVKEKISLLEPSFEVFYGPKYGIINKLEGKKFNDKIFDLLKRYDVNPFEDIQFSLNTFSTLTMASLVKSDHFIRALGFLERMLDYDIYKLKESKTAGLNKIKQLEEKKLEFEKIREGKDPAVLELLLQANEFAKIIDDYVSKQLWDEINQIVMKYWPFMRDQSYVAGKVEEELAPIIMDFIEEKLLKLTERRYSLKKWKIDFKLRKTVDLEVPQGGYKIENKNGVLSSLLIDPENKEFGIICGISYYLLSKLSTPDFKNQLKAVFEIRNKFLI